MEIIRGLPFCVQLMHDSESQHWDRLLGIVVAPAFINWGLQASGVHTQPSFRDTWSALTGPGSPGPGRALQKGEPRGPPPWKESTVLSGQFLKGPALGTGSRMRSFLVGKEPPPLLISPEKLCGVSAKSTKESKSGNRRALLELASESEGKWQQRPFSQRR